uniref:Integrase catalytic domain-containing protein n=1 Tax=Nicotiana tabacum TaxID=4097 RepID=A0A1S3X715_TOBAC|nr:PREDICTED: uncharacterized protein LOC107761750 [Nicotiana tabacum]
MKETKHTRTDEIGMINGMINAATPIFTPEQYQQILRILSKEKGPAGKNTPVDVANMAGPLQWQENQFSSTVKIFRSDNGYEFFNSLCSNLFQTKAIVHQSSCVYTPQQNGVVEWKHRYLLEVGRALRFQTALPLKLWGECILAATYIINKLPSTVLHEKTPYELFHGCFPKLDYLRTIGCLWFSTRLDSHDKFQSKSIPVILLGYASTQKGYKLYELNSRKIFVSRDVIFKKNIFPFKCPKEKFLSSQHDSSTLMPAASSNIFSPSPTLDYGPVPSTQASPTSPPLSPITNLPASPSEPQSPLFTTNSFPAAESIPSDTLLSSSPMDPATSAEPSSSASPDLPPSRKSGRTSKPPIWLTDYVHLPLPSTPSTSYPIQYFISYTYLSPSFKAFLTSFSADVEPSSFHQASKDDICVEAMKLEIEALEQNNT